MIPSYAALFAYAWFATIVAAIGIAAACRQSRRADEARAQARLAMSLRARAELTSDGHAALSDACFKALAERWELEGLP